MMPIPAALIAAIEERDRLLAVRPTIPCPSPLTPRPDLDLRGCDLRHHDLFDLVLPGVRLDEACLDNVSLNGAYLMEAQIAGASFRGADLRRAILDSSRVSDSDFSMSNLRGTIIRYGQWHQALFRNAYLYGTDFYNARLQNCDWHGADLAGANLAWTEIDNCRIYQVGPLSSLHPQAFQPHSDYLVLKRWSDHHEITKDLFDLGLDIDLKEGWPEVRPYAGLPGIGQADHFCGTLVQFRRLVDWLATYYADNMHALRAAEELCAALLVPPWNVP